MKILALELSSARGSIAWADGDAVVDSSVFANDRKHSGLFFEHVQQFLMRFGKPDRIAVGLGPGSYAGTRIAIAAAIGLQTAFDARLVGMPSLCAIGSDNREYAVVGDARRNSFYIAHVRERRCVSGPQLCSEEELREQIASATSPIFATEFLPGFGAALVAHPSAAILAELATREHTDLATAPLEPIYLREPHITQARNAPAAAK